MKSRSESRPAEARFVGHADTWDISPFAAVLANSVSYTTHSVALVVDMQATAMMKAIGQDILQRLNFCGHTLTLNW